MTEEQTWTVVDWTLAACADERSAAGPELRTLLQRAEMVCGGQRARIILVVLEQDRPIWRPLVTTERVIEQPFDRGSAPAVLLGGLAVERLAPQCEVQILGRAEGRMPVQALTGYYRKNAPALYRASKACLGHDASPANLFEVYPFLAELDFHAVVR